MTNAVPFNPFEAHSTIHIDDATNLPEFEELVATYLAPEMRDNQRIMWDARPRLADALRPPTFNGRMANIAIQAMSNPLEASVTAKQRGFRFSHGQGGKNQLDRMAKMDECDELLGFTYTADAYSTGRGKRGQVQAELWYYPSTEMNAYNTAVTRLTTVPKIETQDYIYLVDTSTKIALMTLRSAIKNARPNGFHN